MAEDGYECMLALESHGIPTTYEESDLIATSGEALWAFGDEEIRGLLSKGVLLDAVAAKVLFDRGFGEAIGIRSIQPPVFLDELGALSAEEFFNPDFGGAEKKFLTLTLPNIGRRPNFSRIEPAADAQIVSRAVDPDAQRRHVCLYAYENAFGGRVAVYAFDLASAFGAAFPHTFRKEQLLGVLRWLGRGRLPVAVEGDGVYPLAFRKDCGDTVLLGLFNLSLDPWTFVQFELDTPRTPQRCDRLLPSGRWRRDEQTEIRRDGDVLKVQRRGPVPYDQPLMLSLGDWR